MSLRITVQIDTTVPSGGRIRIVNQSVTGPPGTNGVGVPAGGTTGQILNKTSNADYATGWLSRATLAADSAFSTAYAAKTHASTHGAAGADPVTLAQSQITNLTTDLAAKAPATPTVGTGLGTSGTVNLDMSSLNGTYQTISLAGSITFTTSNRAAGRTVTVRLVAGGSSRTLAWPSWVFVGSAAPSSLASGKTAVVTVTFFGTADTDGVAAYAAQP